MAKLEGILKLSGSLDDLSFFKTKFGYVVRRKGGFASKRLKKDKVYERSRETASEFGGCSRAGKLIREGFKLCIKQKGDPLMTSRLNSVLLKIKNLDPVSARGKRNVTTGLVDANARKLLRGFDFNEEAPLSRILKKAVKVDGKNKKIKIGGLLAKKDLVFPKGASHFSLAGGIARINFEKLSSELLVLTEVTLALDGKVQDVQLGTDEAFKTKKGFDLYFLGIRFFQEVSGQLLELKNEQHSPACLVEILEAAF